MDVLTAWAVSNPAVARLLWVLLLVMATFLVWLFFFCCYSWNRSSSSSLERYLAGRWALNPPTQEWVEACGRLTHRCCSYECGAEAGLSFTEL